ncbi:NinE family protein [Salmonella enterica subsp. enterica]|nr:NinE family protein [Salmonella enterica subsp. enterica]
MLALEWKARWGRRRQRRSITDIICENRKIPTNERSRNKTRQSTK